MTRIIKEPLFHFLLLGAALFVLNVPLGQIVNFHELKVTDGITRLMLPGAGQ